MAVAFCSSVSKETDENMHVGSST